MKTYYCPNNGTDHSDHYFDTDFEEGFYRYFEEPSEIPITHCPYCKTATLIRESSLEESHPQLYSTLFNLGGCLLFLLFIFLIGVFIQYCGSTPAGKEIIKKTKQTTENLRYQLTPENN